MCGHLMAAGHQVTVFSRTREKAADLLSRGAAWADHPRDVAEASEIVFTMVGFPADVREVYFGGDGLLSGEESGRSPRDPGALFVDMTTTEPSLAIEIAATARARGAAAIDAPVSGGDVGARNGTLSIMIGGDDADVARARPLFELMGKNIVHQGGPGAGQHTKMCNQIVIAGTMIGVCESLVYGARAGLNLETMLQSIKSGAAGCWTLENLAPRVIRRDFAPGFIAEHFIKDMGIALDEAKRMNLALPGLALVHQLYVAVKAQGHGRGGTQALYLALERLSAS
jgi:3-hydroxyisobutyrate dehydrogenase